MLPLDHTAPVLSPRQCVLTLRLPGSTGERHKLAEEYIFVVCFVVFVVCCLLFCFCWINTIFETWLRTKRLELLRDTSHFCLREDCLPNFNMFAIILLSLFLARSSPYPSCLPSPSPSPCPVQGTARVMHRTRLPIL
jgi:hypothetical protein